MALPAAVTKRTGLTVALADMGLSAHNVVGIGDAENDHSFLGTCECSVAVANALPAVASNADWGTPGACGVGVFQLVERLLEDDLSSLAPKLARHRVLLGRTTQGEPIELEPYGEPILIAGPSGSGKTTIATSLIERLVHSGYQACVVDPEGDHERGLLAAIGSPDHAPAAGEVRGLLADPQRSIAVTLPGVPLGDRPRWFGALLAHLHDLRSTVGRPHWLVVDEAHHVLPAVRDDATLSLPKLENCILITVRPDRLARPALDAIRVVVASHERPEETLGAFARATGRRMPTIPDAPDLPLVWRVRERCAIAFRVAPARRPHLRHRRKYAQGELGEDKSFFFRGPSDALRLRAQNLSIFVQIADGVDDSTWDHHLRSGHYSRWFREVVKDEELAREAAAVEEDARGGLSAATSRQRIRKAIGKRYAVV
jgi:hypothetical protein